MCMRSGKGGSRNSSRANPKGAVWATASAQLECNTTALWLRNFASALSEGDQTAPWLRAMPVFQIEQSTQRASPAPDLHINYYPHENAHECDSKTTHSAFSSALPFSP